MDFAASCRVAEVANRKTGCLSGANSVPISNHRLLAQSSKSMEFLNFKNPINAGCKSVFKRIEFGMNLPGNYKTVSYLEAGILGPIPDPKRIIAGHGPSLHYVPSAYLWPILGLLVTVVSSADDVFGSDTFLNFATSCLDPRAFLASRLPLRILGIIMLLRP